MATMYLASDTDLQSVANKIRSKGLTSSPLAFPSGYNSAIDAFNIGKGLSPAAGAGDIRSGKKAVVNNTTITGTIPDQAATTFNVSGSNQTIAAGRYTTGTQTFRGVTTSNISSGNIKYGVNVLVGDAASAGRIKNVTGTYSTARSELTFVRASDAKTVSYRHSPIQLEFIIPNIPNHGVIRIYTMYDVDYGGPIDMSGSFQYMRDYDVYGTHLSIGVFYPYNGESYSVRPYIGYKIVG